MLRFVNRLLSGLVARSVGAAPRGPTQPGQPNAGSENHARDLQSTFELLLQVIRWAVLLTAVWAVAAGVLQSGRLVRFIPAGWPGLGTGFWADRADWVAPLLGVPIYTLKAFGVTMLLGVAAALAGGFLGFLFGLPRLNPAAAGIGSSFVTPGSVPAGAPPAGGGAAAASAGAPAGGAARVAVATTSAGSGRSWQTSTNLTEISDWLTKIIVGIGLVEAKAIFERFSQLSQHLGAMLFDGEVGSQLVIPSVLITGAVIGFLYGYLFTQLVIAGLVARTDADLGASGIVGPVQTVVPRGVQGRKEDFSDYIQSLVDNNDSGTLDRIAQALAIPVEADLAGKRRAILGAVAAKVNVSDPAGAEKAMDELSNSLQNMTGRTF
jgi:hypothetical protein